MVVRRREFTLEDGDTVWNKLREKGYRTLYITAPYYWGAADPKKLKIVQFAEGDVDITTAVDRKEFSKELNEIKDWMKDHDSEAAKGMEYTLNKMKKLKEVV